VVVDTFAAWAGLKAESEKDAGAVEEAVEALKEAAASGLAVLLIHHHRKGGGENGEAVRGSSALLAAVDISLDLTRLAGEDAPPRQRMLAAQSRWPGTPDALLVELAEDGETYRLIGAGERDELRRAAADAPVLEAVSGLEPGLTTAEVAEAIGQERQTANRALLRLVKRGQLVRSGRGVSGDPYRYREATPEVCAPPDVQTGADLPTGGLGESARLRPPVGGQTQTDPGGGMSAPAGSGADLGAPAEDDLERWREMAGGGAS
jgi:hypothetical protein